MPVNCGPGMHSHTGYEKCHKISTVHTNPKTQQYHEMALAGKRFEGKDEDLGIEEHDEPKIPPEKLERIKANNKKIRQALNQLTRGKFKSLFIPLTAILWTYDGMSNKIADYKKKAKFDNDRKMAEIYEKTVDEIVKEMPDIDVDSWGEDTIKALTEGYREKVESLKAKIKEKGTRNCPEYAKYKAYRDYLLMADEKQAKIAQRVIKERAKMESTLRGTRSANNRHPKLKQGKGGAMTKEEFFKQYPELSYANRVLSPLEEWEQIQQRIADREKEKEEAEHKKIEELGSQTRTSPMGKTHRKPIIK